MRDPSHLGQQVTKFGQIYFRIPMDNKGFNAHQNKTTDY